MRNLLCLTGSRPVSTASSDTASRSERMRQKLDPFENLREYTALSPSATYDRAKSEAELAEYKNMTAPVPAVNPWYSGRRKLNSFQYCH